jgi:diaminohydroxyphosphoribosylaminopyrimidine deaminase/5-amino-6-(5-phosphoribosylamino)uracil reductase
MDELDLLREAVELSRRCPPSDTAFSVGAIVVDRDGNRLAEGYSRQDGDRDHAEEAALRSLAAGDPRLAGATIFSSLERRSSCRATARACCASTA